MCEISMFLQYLTPF